jgi:hypothetical protein
MVRYFFLCTAIVSYLVAAARADDSAWLTDAYSFNEPSLGGLFDSARGDADQSNGPAASESIRTAFAVDDEDLPAPSADEPATDGRPQEIQRPYHPVCGCGCHTPYLGDWCVWDVAGCGYPCEHHPCECSHGNCRLTEDGCWVCNDAYCDVWGPPVYKSNAAVRFGWWGVGTDGSENKVGEFQDLDSSPFWDLDLISSNGTRTWDIALSGLDNEANNARIRYYGPHSSGRFDFQRYFRQLDHDPLAGFDLPPNPVAADIPPGPPPEPQGNVIVDDLHLGQDYAIRVEELDARYQGRITDHLKWRLNLWGQRKFGERQSTATAHCFNVLADAPAGQTGNVCHVLSQRQSIDWLTMEIQPVVEASFENVAVEYSRTMRAFEEDDQSVFRQYTRFDFQRPAASGFLGPEYEYALVPESFTQIDRLKISAKVTECNQLYANLYIGETENKFREMHRDYDGYDLRWINRSLDDVTLTGYASRYDENNDFPPFFLVEPPFAPEPVAPALPLEEQFARHLIDYRRTRAGIKGTWQPFGDRGPRSSNYGLWDGTSLASGYEYYLLERDFVTWNVSPVPFTQPNTTSHQIEFGPSTRWSRSFDTYTRYKVRFIDDPLIGVSERAEDDPAGVQGTFNTKLPEEEHIVEVGGTWAPAANFMTTTQFNFINRWHRSEFANFSEDDYPMVVTVWYAPTCRLSLTGGYAYYSNWIDQDITLGAARVVQATGQVNTADTETTRWDYAGENHLVSLGANYMWTPRVQLVGGYEFNHGSNTFNIPLSPHAGVDWSTVEDVADVIVETHRVTAGVDWQPYCDMNVYLRYILFDYDDISADITSGTAHMVLAGATRTW